MFVPFVAMNFYIGKSEPKRDPSINSDRWIFFYDLEYKFERR